MMNKTVQEQIEERAREIVSEQTGKSQMVEEARNRAVERKRDAWKQPVNRK